MASFSPEFMTLVQSSLQVSQSETFLKYFEDEVKKNSEHFGKSSICIVIPYDYRNNECLMALVTNLKKIPLSESFTKPNDIKRGEFMLIHNRYITPRDFTSERMPVSKIESGGCRVEAVDAVELFI